MSNITASDVALKAPGPVPSAIDTLRDRVTDLTSTADTLLTALDSVLTPAFTDEVTPELETSRKATSATADKIVNQTERVDDVTRTLHTILQRLEL